VTGPARRPAGLPTTLDHFIGGGRVASVDGETFEVADPVSNQPYATVAAFTEGPWPGLAARARARARILNQIADGIEARAGRIAELETFDTGLPLTQARGQAARAAENFRFFADMVVTQHEDAFASGTQFGYVIRSPAGVAGLITPWNTPFMLETWKLAPALASAAKAARTAWTSTPSPGSSMSRWATRTSRDSGADHGWAATAPDASRHRACRLRRARRDRPGPGQGVLGGCARLRGHRRVP
jgi:5-carboxymethyl-2-hydroxymuconic-semialdehyde dehydrogenase